MTLPSQANLFEPINSVKAIPGLTYLPNFITPTQEAELVAIIDQQPWLSDLKRRVQHYGYKYDYQARSITQALALGAIPDWLEASCKVLHNKGLFPAKPDQVIINEYQPGQGIASHIDCIPCFEGIIASLSLGSPCVMDFTHSNNNEKITVLLEPCSLLILSGDARYVWKHGISGRKTDKHQGVGFSRRRRISLTFRKIVLKDSTNTSYTSTPPSSLSTPSRPNPVNHG